MVLKRSKLSRGIGKLIKRKEVNHFEGSHNVFLEDPTNRYKYLESFTQAQLNEIASAHFK